MCVKMLTEWTLSILPRLNSRSYDMAQIVGPFALGEPGQCAVQFKIDLELLFGVQGCAWNWKSSKFARPFARQPIPVGQLEAAAAGLGARSRLEARRLPPRP